MQDWSEEGGEAGQYSPGASSRLTQIVPYSASLYTVFHSVIYNSVSSRLIFLKMSTEDIQHVSRVTFCNFPVCCTFLRQKKVT